MRWVCWVVLSIVFMSSCSVCPPVVNTFSPIPFQQASHHLLHLDNGQIEYCQLGVGRPIVLITGYAADISSWNRYFIERLATQHQLIVVNNRNIGKSYIAGSLYTTEVLAEDTYQLIQKLHLYKPAVIGISMGGMIAQHFAVRHPHSLSRLVLINTAIAGDQSVPPALSVKENLFQLPQNKVKRTILLLRLCFPLQWMPQMCMAMMRDRFMPEGYVKLPVSDITLHQQQNLLLLWSKDNGVAKQLSKLMVPTLILSGLSDQLIPPQNSMILAEALAHAILLQWKEGGHAMIYQYPYGIADEINYFLATPNWG